MNDEKVIDALGTIEPPTFHPISSSEVLSASRRRKRRRVATQSALAIVAVGAVLAAVLVRPFDGSSPAPAVALPPRDASVTEVADAYLRAVEDKRCSFARALAKAGANVWCGDPVLLAYKRDGEPSILPAGQTGGDPQTCVPFVIKTGASKDHSIVAGEMPWSLCFVRTEDGWRLSDQGHM